MPVDLGKVWKSDGFSLCGLIKHRVIYLATGNMSSAEQERTLLRSLGK